MLSKLAGRSKPVLCLRLVATQALPRKKVRIYLLTSTSEESQNMSGNDNTQPVENSIISEESLRTTSNAPGVSDEHVLVEDPSPQTESQ